MKEAISRMNNRHKVMCKNGTGENRNMCESMKNVGEDVISKGTGVKA